MPSLSTKKNNNKKTNKKQQQNNNNNNNKNKQKQDDSIKTKRVMLMIKLNIDFLNNQRDVTLRQMTGSVKVSNSYVIQSVSILSARFREIQLKLNEVCWWQSQTEEFQQLKW